PTARAEAGADQHGRATRADGRAAAAETACALQERLDLAHARLDGDELGAPLDDEDVVEMVAAGHLEREPAQPAETTRPQQHKRTPLAPELARGRSGRLVREEPHAMRVASVTGFSLSPTQIYDSCSTTSRSSVISRTAKAGPSRVLPESLTPP